MTGWTRATTVLMSVTCIALGLLLAALATIAIARLS